MGRRGSLALGLFCVITLSQAPASAITPTEVLRPAVEELTRILDDPSLKPLPAERQARVRAVARELFDFTEIARRALGRHWRPLSPAEREEFVDLFRDFLEHTYLPKISLYRGERVRFVSESVDGDLATVQSLVITRRGKEIPVSYRMNQRDGRWRIFDISAEGISFIANYRSQFDQIIGRGSFRALTQRLRQKLTSPPDETAPGIPPLLRGSR